MLSSYIVIKIRPKLYEKQINNYPKITKNQYNRIKTQYNLSFKWPPNTLNQIKSGARRCEWHTIFGI
jgi:hypothetical protein